MNSSLEVFDGSEDSIRRRDDRLGPALPIVTQLETGNGIVVEEAWTRIEKDEVAAQSVGAQQRVASAEKGDTVEVMRKTSCGRLANNFCQRSYYGNTFLW